MSATILRKDKTMNFFERILVFLTSKIESAPISYGPFHFFMLGLVVLTTVILCIKFKDADDKTFRRLLLVLWCIMVVGELYHQTCFFFHVEDGVAVWDYEWYKFPFQFCATPLYILPFTVFPKSERIRDCALAFMMSFSLFAGLAVIIYPNDVFVSLIGASIQSMIHHGLQAVIGILIGVHNRHRLNFKFYIGGVPIFVILITIAMIMNIAGYHILQNAGMDDTFNMFYVSPYFACHLPVLNVLYPILPYPVFLLTYLFGFIGVGALVFYLVKVFVKLAEAIKEKNLVPSKRNKKLYYAGK